MLKGSLDGRDKQMVKSRVLARQASVHKSPSSDHAVEKERRQMKRDAAAEVAGNNALIRAVADGQRRDVVQYGDAVQLQHVAGGVLRGLDARLFVNASARVEEVAPPPSASRMRRRSRRAASSAGTASPRIGKLAP